MRAMSGSTRGIYTLRSATCLSADCPFPYPPCVLRGGHCHVGERPRWADSRRRELTVARGRGVWEHAPRCARSVEGPPLEKAASSREPPRLCAQLGRGGNPAEKLDAWWWPKSPTSRPDAARTPAIHPRSALPHRVAQRRHHRALCSGCTSPPRAASPPRRSAAPRARLAAAACSARWRLGNLKGGGGATWACRRSP